MAAESRPRRNHYNSGNRLCNQVAQIECSGFRAPMAAAKPFWERKEWSWDSQ
jgi:hypothetical protein